MLLPRILLLLVSQLFQSADHAESGVAWLDNVVYIAIRCGIVRVAEQVIVFFLLLFRNSCPLGRILDGPDLLRIKDLHRTFCTHDCYVRRRPRIVYITAQLLATHGYMGSTVRFPQGNGHLRDGCFSVGIQKFCSVGNDSAVLLLGPAKETRNIHKGHKRNIERVAEAHETGGLARSVYIEDSCKNLRLISHDSH